MDCSELEDLSMPDPRSVDAEGGGRIGGVRAGGTKRTVTARHAVAVVLQAEGGEGVEAGGDPGARQPAGMAIAEEKIGAAGVATRGHEKLGVVRIARQPSAEI